MRRVVSQHVAGAEDDLVLVHAELDRRPRRRAIRPSSVSARAGTIASSSGAVAFERRLLDGQPVGVGRGHHQLARLEAHEDAGQHRARLVPRCGAADPRDRLEQRLRGRRVNVCAASTSGRRGKSSAL